VNEILFQIALREEYNSRSNAIWGWSENIIEANQMKREQELVSLKVTRQAETIFFGFLLQ
jgi:hypothetical protein